MGRRNHRGVRMNDGEHRDARRHRIVRVDHVGAELAQRLAYVSRGPRTETDSRDRAIEANGDRPPHDTNACVTLRLVSRSENQYVVTTMAKMLRDLPNVRLDSARSFPAIGADLDDSHPKVVRVEGTERWVTRSGRPELRQLPGSARRAKDRQLPRHAGCTNQYSQRAKS